MTIQLIERNNGFTLARSGQVLTHLDDTEANELNADLSHALRPISTAVTPAKAMQRLRPTIQRYPVQSSE